VAVVVWRIIIIIIIVRREIEQQASNRQAMAHQDWTGLNNRPRRHHEE